MKIIAICLIVVITSTTSCNTKTPKADVISLTSTTKHSACYAYEKNNDRVYLHLEDSAGLITGNLSYNFYEKDSNKGFINGEMKGDTLLADYTFMSEGIESVRQVAFLKKGNNMVEGYAAAEEKNGKTVFKKLDSLKFGNLLLSPVDCKD